MPLFLLSHNIDFFCNVLYLAMYDTTFLTLVLPWA